MELVGMASETSFLLAPGENTEDGSNIGLGRIQAIRNGVLSRVRR